MKNLAISLIFALSTLGFRGLTYGQALPIVHSLFTTNGAPVTSADGAATQVGDSAQASKNSVSVGRNSNAQTNSVALGDGAIAWNGGVSIGRLAFSPQFNGVNDNIMIGNNATLFTFLTNVMEFGTGTPTVDNTANFWGQPALLQNPVTGSISLSPSVGLSGNGGNLTNLNAVNQEYTFGYIQVNVFTNGSKPGSSGQTLVGNSENGRIPFQVPAGYPVKNPRVWVANNFYNLCCYIESTNPFPYTIQAAWEYPSNVFTPVTWNGNVSVTMVPTDGTPIPSDQSTNIFPANATVFLRYYLTAAQQGFYPISQRQAIAGNLTGGAVQQGTNLAMNLNAPIPASNITFSWSPFALSATRADGSQNPPVAIVMVGDSIAQGLNGFSWVQNAFSNNIAVANYGKVGSGIGINSPPENAAYIKYCNTVICQAGINNFRNGGVTFATMTNLLVQEWLLYANAGKKVYQTTFTPYTTSTDSWATTNNQTVVGTCEPVRVPLNAWIKTKPYPLSGYVDLAAACASPNPAFWIPNLTSDGLHPEGQGVTSLAAVGVNLQNLGLYQTVSGNQTNYSGSFAGDGSSLTGIQASNVVGVVQQNGTFTNANFTGNIAGNSATVTMTGTASTQMYYFMSQGGSLGGLIGVVNSPGQIFVDGRQSDYVNKEQSGSHRELLGSGSGSSSIQIDSGGVNFSVPITNASGYYGFSSTNTLIVTSGGLTNGTTDTYLISTTAGTGMTLKDGNGNQFLSPIINSTFLLKPNFRFAGITITATAQIFNK